ncbi:MAG: hypothetical protein IPO27_11360 [Bacteroidetes bacterium]|nr:hypothetical protein [Bacteroidota bacterium]
MYSRFIIFIWQHIWSWLLAACFLLPGAAGAQVRWSMLDTDSTQKVVIRNLLITGNKKTKERIITREIIYHAGDSLSIEVLDKAILRSQSNLLNTNLFNFVETNITGSNNQADITIIVKERWYIWPFPILEAVDRNFNEWYQTKDLSRLNYGMYVLHENFRGAKEKLQVNARFGYSLRLGINYSLPYIDKAQSMGLNFSAGTQQFREVPFKIIDNKLQFLTLEDGIARRETFGGMRYTYRKGIYSFANAFAEYRNIRINDSLIMLSPAYLGKSQRDFQLLILGVSYRYENVDFNVYPLRGFVFSTEIMKQGIGLLQNEPDVTNASIGIRVFKPLSTRWHYAYSIRLRKYSYDKIPYYFQRGLGYGSEFVRGFELYVVNGNFHGVAKSCIKYSLLPQTKVKINWIPTEKFNTIPLAFYININADAGYARDRYFFNENFLSNKMLASLGASFDVVTYYNLVWSFNYTFTNINRHGFYIHFSSPI